MGFTNLAAHYPKNAETAPDLGEVPADSRVRITDEESHIGPKLYVACGAEDEVLNGTTRLHVDVADAVNLTTWTVDASRPCAIWHIFPRTSATALRSFLKETSPDHGDLDPIHSQSFYLTDTQLQRLAEEHDVVPWSIEQRLGDFIVIPAGCAHQVRRCTGRSRGGDD